MNNLLLALSKTGNLYLLNFSTFQIVDQIQTPFRMTTQMPMFVEFENFED